MVGEWNTATVLELQREGLLLVEDGNHGEYRPRLDEFVDVGVAFIRAADMDPGRVLFESAARINEKARERITKGICAPGDVLLSHKGTVGKVALVADDAPPFVCSPQTTFWRTLDQKRLDREYLYAFLRSPGFHAQLATRAGETDMAPYVSLTSQRGMSVTVPPIGTQRSIAHILGTLDDKIQLNRRMNETLEAMARALFKSWFVDFDPVRAKHALSKVEGAEGRPSASSGQAFPGLPKPLADLFPDSFEDSELGEIPKGWKVEPLSEITTTITKGTTPTQGDSSTADKGDGRINYVRVNSIGEDGAVLFDKLIKIPKSVHLGVLKRSILQANDVLYTIAGTIGRTAIVDESLLPANTNQAVAVVRPKQAIPAIFLAMTMQESTFREELHSNIVQAVQANLSLGTLSRARTVIPPRDTLVELFMPIADFAKRVASSRSESRALAALRDTLLPKLISGDLRLRDTEQRMKEEAA